MELMRRSGRTKFSISILYASAFGVVVASRDGSAAFFSPRSSRWNRRSSAGQAPLAPAALSTCQRRLLQGDFGGIVESASASSSPPGSVAHSAHSSASPGQIETVRGETVTEETVKKSRFIARCGHASTFEEAKLLLHRVLQEHPKARHSCWAWRGLGANHRFSDDGEPGGTAGQPILAGIESEGVSEVMVVVTRYFGGIKLGTGGLCRAYGGAARLCVQAAEREIRKPVKRLRVKAPVESVGAVYRAVTDCERLAEEFTADGSVVVSVAVELTMVGEVRRRIQDGTRGAAEIVDEESNSLEA